MIQKFIIFKVMFSCLIINSYIINAQTLYSDKYSDVKIITPDSILCEGESTILRINFPIPDSSNIIIENIRSWLYSGLGSWDYSDDFQLIKNYSHTYGLPGMMIYGDSTQRYGVIEAEIRQTGIGAQANAGIAMAVTLNRFKDAYPYNGPGCYFLAISEGKVELFNGTWNTPAEYASGPIASATVPGLIVRNWNKVRLEIMPNAHVYGYVNDKLYIDYKIPDDKVPQGYFSLVTSNSHNEFRSVSSYYFPIDIFWSTGETTPWIKVEPHKTKDYSFVISGINRNWTDTITIIVNQTKNVVEFVKICEGEKYFEWNKSGQYVRTLQSQYDCDSIVTTFLTVNKIYKVIENIAICEGESYKGWSSEGQHQEIFESVTGCDSIVITNLTFHPVTPTKIAINSDYLISETDYSSYQWYSKEKGLIDGATEKKYAPNESGSYYFIARNATGCIVESNTVTLVYTSSNSILLQDNSFLIFPNPNNGKFILRLDSKYKDSFTLTLYNPVGQIVDSRKIQISELNHIENFNINHLSKGIYLMAITSEFLNVTQKIIVN